MRTALLLTLALGPALAHAGSVRVAPRAEVSRSVVRLGDVARLTGFDAPELARLSALELGRAPVLGTGQLLPRAFLESSLRAAGLPPGTRLDLPARLEVVRRTEVVKGADLRERVAASIRGASPEAGDVAAVEVPAIPDLKVPAGASIDVRFEPGEDFSGPVSAEVRVTDGGETVRMQRVNAHVERLVAVQVAGQTLRRGDTTTGFEVRHLPAREVPADALAAGEDVPGAKLRRDVRAGEVVRRAWLELPPLVGRGDRVTLVARRGAVQLTAVGEALGRGTLGETVRVRNVASQKVVAGRVAGPQTIEIVF